MKHDRFKNNDIGEYSFSCYKRLQALRLLKQKEVVDSEPEIRRKTLGCLNHFKRPNIDRYISTNWKYVSHRRYQYLRHRRG